MSCPECRVAGGATPDMAVSRRGSFVVHRRAETTPVPGWLVIAPARHVEQIDDLRPDELAELGPLLAEVAAALRAETPCEKVYVAVFAEVLPHLHFHVVARPPDLAVEHRGPGLFTAGGQAVGAEAVARRVLARLAPPRRRDRPLLLSALVCPGAGQLAKGEYLKGLALVGLTLLATALFFWRAGALVLQALGAAGPVLGPGDALALAGEAWIRIRGEFLLFTAVLAVLWGASVYDISRRR